MQKVVMADPAHCPSTHCNRSGECRSPHECACPDKFQKTWGDVFWKHVRRGCDRSDAAYRADLWLRSKGGDQCTNQ